MPPSACSNWPHGGGSPAPTRCCGAAEPDVEAILICRTGGTIEYFLVPIDACYELVGQMRLKWRGFDGGAEARASIEAFLADVRERARVYAGETPDG